MTHPSTIDPAGIVAELERARARTLALVDDLGEADQVAQHSPLMSPLVWDLAHIGNYEELWLLRAVDGRPAVDEQLDWLYNAFEHPRWTRPELPLLGPADARRYLAEVRSDVLDLLGKVDPHSDDALLRGGFVYGMVLQHEHQHAETMLATRQLMLERAPAVPGADRVGPTAPAATAPAPPTEMVRIDGGPFITGTDSDPWAYDNERGAHEVHLDPFLIDATPVTNAMFREFVDAGGYDDPRLWQPSGWAWRNDEAADHPLFWRREADGSWSVLRFGRGIDLDAILLEPVQHVCWYEADAFARWCGKRLPTEAEWERAATWHPTTGKRRHPWGDAPPSRRLANLGQQADGPGPVASHPAGASPDGVHDLIGGVWEWTASGFTPYPGFRSFPYDEYSQVFFGSGYKVLRGGSWAADPLAVRGTFRNWDYPIRRQIFAGFRCAKDA